MPTLMKVLLLIICFATCNIDIFLFGITVSQDFDFKLIDSVYIKYHPLCVVAIIYARLVQAGLHAP